MQREPFVVGFPADDFRRTNWNLRSDLERPVLSPPERDGIQGCLVLCRAGLTFYIRADGKYDEFSKDFREKRLRRPNYRFQEAPPERKQGELTWGEQQKLPSTWTGIGPIL
jgi:hypothetical protein